MRHLHKSSGLYFECGELMDFPVKDARKTYDMTVITLWNEDEDSCESPIIVDYYFGEYSVDTTDYYIDQWFDKRAMDKMWNKFIGDCASIVDAYYITNEGMLDETTERKVQTVRDCLNNLVEVYNNEKH